MTPTTTSSCPSCGGAVLPGDRFCGSCGRTVAAVALSDPAGAAATEPTPVAPPAPRGDTSPWGVVAAHLQSATLGEFEILSELGRGGMAAVYLARDLALNRRVAIKVMAPGLLLGPGMVERFRQEAVTVANLQHAHIVAIHAVRQLDDLHFFVMQFVPGRTLEGVLRAEGALPIEVVRAWLYQVGSALGYAHRRGVIHRDIKPGNILLNIDGEAVVTDFGIAKVAESPSHTQTGTVVGTPVYMSPEQCYARELTGASDQYSLGVVAYEMLAGKPPFSGSSFALMRAHTDEPPPPLREARPDVPPAMEAAILRMLAKRPEERFATLGEALVSLGATPLAPDAPLHATLATLAAATERLQQLGDVLRTPASPVPRTRESRRPDGAPATPRTPVPATQTFVVAIAPAPSDLEPGATVHLRATVKHSTGNQTAAAADLQWTSSDQSVVTVDSASGALTAVGPGTATISAATGAASDSVEVAVGAPRAARVEIAIPPGPFHPGDRIPVSATVTSRFDQRVVRPVEWRVEEPALATLERRDPKPAETSASIRAIAPGMVGVIATCDGVTGRATVRIAAAPVVEPPPMRMPTAPAPPDRSRGAAPPPSATTVLPPASPRRPTARSQEDAGSTPPASPASPPSPAPAPPVAGPVPVTQKPSAGAASSAPGTPGARPAATPPAAPAAATPATSPRAIPVGKPGKRGAWRWAVPAVAVVAAAGWFATRGIDPTSTGDSGTTGPADSVIASDTARVVPPADSTLAGGTRDTAAAGTARDSTAPRPDSVLVTTPVDTPAAARVPRRIDVRPTRPAAIVAGESLSLAATVRDAAGSPLRDARVTWATADPRVASVDATRGVVRGVAAGTTRITARAGDVTSILAVTVVPAGPDPATVVAIEMSDVRPMTVGEFVRLTATARNGAGAPASGVVVQWSSSNTDVASVSAAGTVTARATGSATITATAGGKSAERTVTVRAREVVTRPDTPAAPPPAGAPKASKTEAELRSEIQAVLATYARAIQTRDTSLIRRVFPNAGSELLNRWQATFDDARGVIEMTGGAIEILDPPRDAAGAQVRARARYSARFYSRAARSEQSFPVAYTAVVQRDGSTWRITSIR